MQSAECWRADSPHKLSDVSVHNLLCYWSKRAPASFCDQSQDAVISLIISGRGVFHRRSLSGDFREQDALCDLHHLPRVAKLQPWWASVLPPVPTWGGYSWQTALLTWQPSRKATIWLPAEVTFFPLFSEVGPSQEEGSLALWVLGPFPDTLAARATGSFASGLLISHSKRSSVLYPIDRQGFIFYKTA